MNQDTFIYTLPQWFVFASILVTVYGWIERKKYFRIIGSVVLILLGIYAVWAITKGYFSANHFLTPDEIISEELEEDVIEEMPFQGQLLPAYISFIVSAVLSFPAIYFDWKDIKPNRLFYILAGLVILLKNVPSIFPGLKTIFYYAFHTPAALGGGLLGTVVRAGVARGLFSNEAGLGSDDVREGLVAMLGPFVDTLVVCTITGLVIVCTGAYDLLHDKGQLTSFAFDRGWAGSGRLVNIGILLFALSTLIAWSYYGDRATAYLFGKKAVRSYRWVYVGFVVLGALRPLDDVINFCDGLNGLMAVPNLIALIVLTPVVVKLTKDYMGRHHGA